MNDWRKHAEQTLRTRNGPRQPGGGKQTAGLRQRPRFGGRAADAPAKRFGARAADAPAKRFGKPAGAAPGRQRPPSGKPASGRSKQKYTKSEPRRYDPGRTPLAPKPRRKPDEKRERIIRPLAPAPAPEPEPAPAPAPLPTSVQNVTVTDDENGMRVDRFFEAKFPGLSFSHIQRVIRKGEVRVNGKRTEPKNRLEAGQTVRIPPLRLDQPKPRADGGRGRRENAGVSQVDHALRRRRRPGVQQADGPCGAGRLRHHAASRRHARGFA